MGNDEWAEVARHRTSQWGVVSDRELLLLRIVECSPEPVRVRMSIVTARARVLTNNAPRPVARSSYPCLRLARPDELAAGHETPTAAAQKASHGTLGTAANGQSSE